MCAGLLLKDSEHRLYFPNPKAVIYAYTEDGEAVSGRWGVRTEEEAGGADVPVTGWARFESLKNGRWNRFCPQKVYIPADSFMEKDKEGASHWFDLDENERILGVMLANGSENFIYIVTVPSDEEKQKIHDRWPMIVDNR